MKRVRFKIFPFGFIVLLLDKFLLLNNCGKELRGKYKKFSQDSFQHIVYYLANSINPFFNLQYYA